MTRAEIRDWINEHDDIGQRRPTWEIEAVSYTHLTLPTILLV